MSCDILQKYPIFEGLVAVFNNTIQQQRVLGTGQLFAYSHIWYSSLHS